MNIGTIFFDGRHILRSGWRAAAFIAAYFFVVILLFEIFVLVQGNAGGEMLPGSPGIMLISSMMWLIPALAVGWACGKYFEGLPFRALGAWFSERWLLHFIAGLLIGVLSFCFAVAVAAMAGGLWFEVNGGVEMSSILSSMALSFAFFAVAAAFEEALFRGYILQTFARAGYAWPAIFVTSLLFGLAHYSNPSSGTLSTINTVLAGIWFGAAYLKTRDLWFVWGMHLIWNWIQGSVFGIEVSGLTQIVSASVLKEIDSGPAWLTGGEYGIEGGIACTVALIASCIAIYFLPLLKPDAEIAAMTSPPEAA